MACDANTLIAQAAANGYYDLDDRSLKIAILQLLCSGGGAGGITLAQALAYVEANATQFSQPSVGFNALNVAGLTTLAADGSISVSAGNVHFNVDGSGQMAGGNITWSADGSAQFVGGAIHLSSDGSASFASGAGVINSTGALDVGAGASLINPDGSATFTGGDVEIADNSKGVIIKSPDNTRYRIVVANGGALSTTPA